MSDHEWEMDVFGRAHMPNKPNVPLLRKAVEWAEAENARPEYESEWYQGTWQIEGRAIGRECGTAYCIAGYVAQVVDERYKDTNIVDGRHASAVAAEALGIPARVYDSHGELWAEHELFNGGNQIEDVRRIAEEVAESTGERL